MTNEQQKLRKLREDSGKSIADICQAMKISQSTWRRWEGQTSRKTEIPFVYLEFFKSL
jgi:transcriptional regulator with XRE-family HTH domain